MQRSTWIKALPIALVTLALASPVVAGTPRHFKRGGGAQNYEWGVGVRIGLFTPEGDSEFWDDTFDTFTGDIEDFEDTSLAFDLHYYVNPVVRLNGSVFGAVGETRQGYVDADIDPFLEGVRHDSELRVSAFTLGAQVMLFGNRQTLRPYVGIGGGFYSWRYREDGDFVFFGEIPEDDEIVFTEFEDDGVTFGYYLNAGVELAITPTVSLTVDGRWHRADDDLGSDFEGFGEIDLSGTEVSVGATWRF
jgi:opacity protein-like surface antigen